LIPYENYKKEKRPRGMTLPEWAVDKFEPNPKYKGKYPKWLFYARFSRITTWGKIYECIPFVAFSKKVAIANIDSFAKKTSRKLLKVWRHGPLSWEGYNVPWVKGTKAAKSWKPLKGV